MFDKDREPTRYSGCEVYTYNKDEVEKIKNIFRLRLLFSSISSDAISFLMGLIIVRSKITLQGVSQIRTIEAQIGEEHVIFSNRCLLPTDNDPDFDYDDWMIEMNQKRMSLCVFLDLPTEQVNDYYHFFDRICPLPEDVSDYLFSQEDERKENARFPLPVNKRNLIFRRFCGKNKKKKKNYKQITNM